MPHLQLICALEDMLIVALNVLCKTRLRQLSPEGLRGRWRKNGREYGLGVGVGGRAVGQLLPDQQLGTRLELSDGSGATRVLLPVGVCYPLTCRKHQIIIGNLWHVKVGSYLKNTL
jgi:hypothetical protein